MFTIFKNKKYLIEEFDGFVDIHNHLLPGIDDGAKNIEDAIALVNQFQQIGIQHFIATPHIMKDFYGNNKATIKEAQESLQEEIKKSTGIKINNNYAAEYMMDTHFEQLVEDNDLLVLKNNLVLVEMSYYQAPINLKEIIFKLFTQGYNPILAHPERYSFFHSKFEQYEQLKNQGVLFQLNALSLTDHYGPHVKKMAYKLLEKGMIDFLGTDTHHLDHVEKLKSIKLEEKKLNLLLPIIEKNKEVFQPN